MKLIINGKTEDLVLEGLTVAALLKGKKVQMPEMVSVELNGEILDRGVFESAILKENDKVEFLYFMGGGSQGFSTKCIHAGHVKDPANGATAIPIFGSAAFSYDSAQDLADVFDGKRYGHVYSRISNPTVTSFEQRVNALEQGRGALAVSSGMAAIATVVFALTGQGDEIVAAKSLFGGTLLFFNDLISKYGVKITYVDTMDTGAYKRAINEKTRLIFLETIANPKLDVPDIKAVAEIAAQNNIPLVVDSTITTPYLFEAKKYGTAIVVHSATKYMTGNGTAIGGVFVDTGAYNWKSSKNPSLEKYAEKFGEFAFLAAARKQVLQNAGSCLSPFNAFLHCLGLETLSLRMEKHCANALAVARHFSKYPAVKSVNYPGLDNSIYKETAARQFNGKFGAIMTFSLGTKEKCFDFAGRIKIAGNLSNIGDAKTLVIHPASTIFHDCGRTEMLDAGVTDDMVRVSVGIEDVEDIIADFEQALT